jgi:Arc/MetJ family transcription regulator
VATHVRIEDALLNEALELSGYRTKREAVTAALEEFVVRRRQRQFLNLEGKIDVDPNYDYKAQRKQT